MAVQHAPAAQGRQSVPSTAAHPPAFRDVALPRGLDFVHVNGASDEKFFPEIMGSGGLFLDADEDG